MEHHLEVNLKEEMARMKMMKAIMNHLLRIKMRAGVLVETQEHSHSKLIRLTIQVMYRVIVRKDTSHQDFLKFKENKVQNLVIANKLNNIK